MKKNKSHGLRFYIGAILNPQSDLKCEYYREGLLVVKQGKKGARIEAILNLTKGIARYEEEMTPENTVSFGKALIMPAFFDMHFHWVQDEVREKPKNSLLEWLDRYTFPAEEKFSNKEYSYRFASYFFKRLTELGTLGGAIFSSIHENALHAAMKNVRGHFVLGQVMMNQNAPAALLQTKTESLKSVKRMIKKYGSAFAFTPRFAICTSPEVMKKGSQWADEKHCFKQSHLAETPDEVAFTLRLYRQLPEFRDLKSYTELYQKVGMLGKRSLMAHGIYLSLSELKLLKKSKTTLIHCPTSNAPIAELGLGSGLFDFRKIEKAKIHWALGSDIGAGPFLSMFDVMQSFVQQNVKRKIHAATYVKALYRATLAGARALRVDHQTGNLNRHKQASFIVVPFQGQVLPASAEKVLSTLFSSLKKNRGACDQMIEQVFDHGVCVFNRLKS